MDCPHLHTSLSDGTPLPWQAGIARHLPSAYVCPAAEHYHCELPMGTLYVQHFRSPDMHYLLLQGQYTRPEELHILLPAAALLMLNIRGDGTLGSGDESMALAPGQLNLLGAGKEYIWNYTPQPGTTTLKLVLLPDEPFWQALQRHLPQVAGDVPQHIAEGKAYRHFPAFAYAPERLVTLQTFLLQTLTMQGQPDLAALHLGTLALFAVALSLPVPATTDYRQPYSPLEKRVRALAAELAVSNEPFAGLHALARRSGTNVLVFVTLFKRLTGDTPDHYQKKHRLLRARHLLLDGQMPLGEIAGMLGFADTHSFSKAFKKQFGTTPAQVKNRQG